MFCEFCGSDGPSDCCVCRSYGPSVPSTASQTLASGQTYAPGCDDTRKGPDATGAKQGGNADILTAG